MRSQQEIKREKAVEALEQGDYWRTITTFTELIKSAPDNAEYHFQLAEAYRGVFTTSTISNEKHWEQALSNYDLAIKFAPQIAKYYAARAECYLLFDSQQSALNDKHYQLALLNYQAALELEPDNDEYRHKKSLLALQLEQKMDANSTLVKAVGPNTKILSQADYVSSYARYANYAKILFINNKPSKLSLTKEEKIEAKEQAISNKPSKPLLTIDEKIEAKERSILRLMQKRRRATLEGFGWGLTSAISGLATVIGLVTTFGLGSSPIGFALACLTSSICMLTTIKALENRVERKKIDSKISAKKNALLRLRSDNYLANTPNPLQNLNNGATAKSLAWMERAVSSTEPSIVSQQSIFKQKSILPVAVEEPIANKYESTPTQGLATSV